MDNDQRVLMTLMLAVATILIMLLVRGNARVRERGARRARRRGREHTYADFEENLCDNESEHTFRRLFRMSKICFTALLDALDDDGRLTRSGLGHSARRKARAAARACTLRAHTHSANARTRAARNLHVAHRALGNGAAMCRPVQHLPG